MVEFAYNNAKNTSTGHTSFELNCGYHSWISYKKNVDFYSQSKSADELSAGLRELMIFAKKIFTMPKNFKNKLTIRESNLGATPLTRKFG